MSQCVSGQAPAESVLSPSTPPTEGVEFITIDELAALARVSTRTARRYVDDGVLPQPKRLGKRLVRWDRSEILRALSDLPRRVA